MLWKDLAMGFLAGCFLSAFMPDNVWKALFLTGGSPWLKIPLNALLGLAAAAITVTANSTFIRGRHDSERHLEVRVGNVETSGGGRQVFGAVARAETEIAVIRRSLETVGQTADIEMTCISATATLTLSIQG